ncbi:MAG TPA: sugar ABC transporter permease [Firmicutes bacterium]|nr:sugar ABC transporter permease [Bacillota bacterium]
MSRSARNSGVGRVMRRIWKDRVSYLFLLPFALLFTLFTVLPVVTSVFYSFTYNNIYEPLRFVGLDNYLRMFTSDAVFPIAVQNTLVFALITGPLGYILSFSLAWLINEVSSGMRMLFVLIFYSPAIAGSIYVVFGVLFSSDAYGYINGFLMNWGFIDRPVEWLSDTRYIKLVISLCVLWSSMGAGFLSFVAGLKNVDRQLYEAAALDGLRNRWQELWYVTLPVMKPQLMFGVVMSISGAFSIHDVTIALAGYPSTDNVATTMVNLMADVGYQRFELGYASAMATVLFAIMIIARQLVNKLIDRVGK